MFKVKSCHRRFSNLLKETQFLYALSPIKPDYDYLVLKTIGKKQDSVKKLILAKTTFEATKINIIPVAYKRDFKTTQSIEDRVNFLKNYFDQKKNLLNKLDLVAVLELNHLFQAHENLSTKFRLETFSKIDCIPHIKNIAEINPVIDFNGFLFVYHIYCLAIQNNLNPLILSEISNWINKSEINYQIDFQKLISETFTETLIAEGKSARLQTLFRQYIDKNVIKHFSSDSMLKSEKSIEIREFFKFAKRLNFKFTSEELKVIEECGI